MPKSPMIRLQHHQQEHSVSCLAACVVMALAHWQVNCIAIRVPQTEEVMATAVASHDLTEKAGIPLAEAQRILQAAQAAADRRLGE